MPDPKVTFEDHTEKADTKVVLRDGKPVGELRKAKHGPGFFLSLDNGKGGKRTWKNAAPGARIAAEKEFAAKETYVKTLKQAQQRVIENP